MAINLSRAVKINQISSLVVTTAAASSSYSAQVDMANYEGCVFIASFASSAASTGTASYKIRGTDTSTAASTSYTTLNGATVTVPASTTASSKRLAIIDCYRPTYRYLKADVVRKAKIGLNGIVAVQYGPRYQPTTPSSSNIATSTVALGNLLAVEAT